MTASGGPTLTRRQLLGAGAALGTSAAFVSFLPPSLRAAAAAAPPTPGGLRAIKHVVVLMQENRSFDHLFGTLRGVIGFGDRTAIRRRDGSPIFRQPRDGGGYVLPFGIREAAEREDQDVQYVASLPHGWPDGQAAWNGGWFDGWVPAKGAATMAYYDRADVPFHYELADTFTVCDQYFASVPSSTSPNRNYLVSGYTGYEPGTHERAVTNAAYDEDHHPGYDWVTYAERLERAGVSWKVYQEWDNFGDNNLEFFASFKAIMAEALAPVDGGIHKNLTSFYGSLWDKPAGEQDALLAQLDASVAKLSPRERSLFERGLRRSRPETLAANFAADVAVDNLPAVTYLVPSAADSEHPGASSPIQSAHITYDILDALASNPDVWAKTAVFLTYDEFDGYFDHVAPPVASVDVHDEYYDGGPVGMGARVPMIVVSPWTVGGFACSEVFDHSSITQFLEKWTGVRSPVISHWRRTAAGDLMSAFDFAHEADLPTIDQPGPVPPFTERWAPDPPEDQQQPAQEPGSRLARPIKYRPEAHAILDGARLSVVLRDRGDDSSHFAIYSYDGSMDRPIHLDVRARDEQVLPLGGTTYDVVVTSPNRFRRDFAGSTTGSAARLTVSSHQIDDDQTLEIRLRNDSGAPIEATLTVLAYGSADPRTIVVPPSRQRAIAWSADAAHGWYDLEITVAADATFRRRITGHLENGKPSVTG